MASITARTIALTDQVLAVLADEAPLPVTTSHVWRAVSPPCDGWPHTACADRHVASAAVYQVLNRLARRGEVEKWAPGEDRWSCLWRRLSIPQDPAPRGETP